MNFLALRNVDLFKISLLQSAQFSTKIHPPPPLVSRTPCPSSVFPFSSLQGFYKMLKFLLKLTLLDMRAPFFELLLCSPGAQLGGGGMDFIKHKVENQGDQI